MSYPSDADFAAIGDLLHQIASDRWLQSEELFIILMMSGDSNRIKIPLLADPVRNPQNGCLCFQSNQQTGKKDGIEWILKKEAFKTSSRVQESTVGLKVNGVEVIHGVYCRTADYAKTSFGDTKDADNMVNFNRRIYVLKKPVVPIVASAPYYMLFHYRESPKAEKFVRMQLHPILDRFWNYLLSINKVPSMLMQQNLHLQMQQQPPPQQMHQQQHNLYAQQSVTGYWAAPNALNMYPPSQPYQLHQRQMQVPYMQHSVQQPMQPPMYYNQSVPSNTMHMNPNVMNASMMNNGMMNQQQPQQTTMHFNNNQQQSMQYSQQSYQQQASTYQPVYQQLPQQQQQTVNSAPVSQVQTPREPLISVPAPTAAAPEFFDDLALDLDNLTENELMDFMQDIKEEEYDDDDQHTVEREGGEGAVKGISKMSIQMKYEEDIPSIVDFSPSSLNLATVSTTSSASGNSTGVKMLICLSSGRLAQAIQLPLMVCFSDTQSSTTGRVPGELITPSVVRCYPASVGVTLTVAGPANCRVCIEDAQGNLLTKITDELFEFVPQKTRSNSHLGKRQLPNKQSQSSVDTSKLSPLSAASGTSGIGGGANIVPLLSLAGIGSSNSNNSSSTGYMNDTNRSGLSFMAPTSATSAGAASTGAVFSSGLPPMSSGRSYSARAQSSRSDDSVEESLMDKENKIRIVEKLGYMKSALLHDEGVQSNSSELIRVNSSNSNDGGGGEMEDEWLDDNQLSKLSHAELEMLMDKYITTVVKHMVQLAALDDDLKAEIDSLDSSGFSLLHYCCLYNLNSLIPVMLAKGADINARTGAGTTALHLAAAAGHLEVVRLLIECDANVHALDDRQLLPSDAARLAGQHLVCNFLMELEDNSSMTDRELKISPCLSSGNTPRLGGGGGAAGGDPTNPLYFAAPGTSVQDFSNSSSLNASFASSGDVNDNESSNLSNKLLHVAFASLSLTDKCALSLSMGQLNKDPSITGTSSGLAALTSPRSGSNSQLNTPRDQGGVASLHTSSSSMEVLLPPRHLSTPQATGPSSAGTPGGGVPAVGGASSASGSNISSGGVGVLPPPHPLRRISSVEDDISEMHSVLSESDKESLVVAMSMMGPLELSQVDDEVRRIQNNVRGWLLRKNYTNLRDAAKVLQMAWREKKRTTSGTTTAAGSSSSSSSASGPLPTASSNTMNYIVQQDKNKRRSVAVGGGGGGGVAMLVSSSGGGGVKASTGGGGDGIAAVGAADVRSDTPALDVSSSSGGSGGSGGGDGISPGGGGGGNGANLSPVDYHQRELQAAEKLQAATRRMIARKSFSSLRKQTMASLVIQKSLVKWWVHNRSTSPVPNSRPGSLRLVKGFNVDAFAISSTNRGNGIEGEEGGSGGQSNHMDVAGDT